MSEELRLRINRVLMWLEYAADPETCELATGVTSEDAVWVAHALLQNQPGKSLDWATEVDAMHAACCAIDDAMRRGD